MRGAGGATLRGMRIGVRVLPGVWVSGRLGRGSRGGPRAWPWAVAVLAVGALVYGATQFWWIGAVAAAVVVACIAVVLFGGARGHRTDFVRALWQTVGRRMGVIR